MQMWVKEQMKKAIGALLMLSALALSTAYERLLQPNLN